MNIIFSSITIVLLNICVFFSTESMEEFTSPFDETYLTANKIKLKNAQRDGIKVLENFPIISHGWIGNLFSQVHNFMSFISLSKQHVLEILPSLEKIIFQTSSPFGDYHEVEQFDTNVSYENFLQMTNVHLLSEWYDFHEILMKIDYLLANIRIQELICRKPKKYNVQRQKSFDSIKRNLLLLRHDMELAIALKQTSLEQFGKEAIQQDSGRVFCVEKKVGTRTICPVGSGTIVNIKEKNYILTCRHLLEYKYSPDSELEIYFIPDNLLNKKDFLPTARLDGTGSSSSSIDWDKYQEYMIKSILLINSSGANTLIDHVVLHTEDIKTLKKIEELTNNNDIMLMTANVCNTIQLVKSKLVPYQDISDKCVVAGYPGGGFADYSFIATKISSSTVYLESCSYSTPPELSDYVFAGFPVTHGMSGGPLFTIDTIPLVFGVLHGADLVQLSTRLSVVTKDFFDQTLKYIKELS